MIDSPGVGPAWGGIMHSIKKLLKLKSWHRIVPRKRKKPEEAKDFLQRIVRLAATRASMASWGQPFEAIASWIITSIGREEGKPAPRD